MALKKCVECTGRFSSYFFSARSQLCRLCVTRRQLEERLKDQDEKLAAGKNTVDELVKTVEALKRLVESKDESHARVGAAAAPTTPAAASQTIPPSAATRPHAQSLPDAIDSHTVAKFTRVRRGAKPVRQVIQPTVCSNRYQILEEDDEPSSSFLIGDSLIRQQLTEFCGRVKEKRRLFCVPGAGVDDVTDLFDQVSEEATNESLFVLHTGTNDVRTTRSEDLLDKYRKLIQQYKTKSNRIMISGVLPRVAADNVFYSKAFSLNNRLETLCKEHGIEFVNMWNDFYNKTGLFQEDGLHLSSVGAARFGRLLSEAVRRFWSKNGGSSQGVRSAQ